MAGEAPLPPPETPPAAAPRSVAVTPAAPLERAALERVLARAAELQAAEADPGEPTLTEAQIIEVGKEVGIPAKHLQQALAEERSRVAVPTESGRVAAMFGAASASASRTVNGTPAAIFDALDAWLQREESLQVKRRFPDRMAWQPRGGLVTEFRRITNAGGHGYRLLRAEEVAATVIAVDAKRCIVRLDASLVNVRSNRLIGGGAFVAGGGVTAGILVALGVMTGVAIVPVAVGAVAGYFVARSHAPYVSAAQLALEQLLDKLERGELGRPSLLAAVAQTAGLRWP